MFDIMSSYMCMMTQTGSDYTVWRILLSVSGVVAGLNNTLIAVTDGASCD